MKLFLNLMALTILMACVHHQNNLNFGDNNFDENNPCLNTNNSKCKHDERQIQEYQKLSPEIAKELKWAKHLYYRGDYADAIPIVEKYAKQNIAIAQYNLGTAYEKGRGVHQDYQQALFWLEQSANQGYVSAQYNLATLYYNGHGVKRNKQTAKIWFEKSAQQGFQPAIDILEKYY